MILPGVSCPTQDSVDTVDTVDTASRCCLRRTVTAAVAGIAFLSGRQSGDPATTRLAAVNHPSSSPLPWPVAFSFGRAALTIRDGQDANASRAQQAPLRRARSNRDARRGENTTTDAAAAAPPRGTRGVAEPAAARPAAAQVPRVEGTAG